MGAKLLSALQEESGLSLSLAEDILQSPEGIQTLSNHKYLVMAYSAKNRPAISSKEQEKGGGSWEGSFGSSYLLEKHKKKGLYKIKIIKKFSAI